jgi:hypothetical protein
MLCALCFVLRANALCLSGVLVTAHEARSMRARSRWPVLRKADAPAHKNWVFLSRTAKRKAQSMSTKQPILTKRCDFEHKAQSTKHKALSRSTKQRQKNWAQAGIPASACTGLYRQKGKINPGDAGSQPKHLHIRRDIKTTNKHLLVLDPMVFLYIF